MGKQIAGGLHSFMYLTYKKHTDASMLEDEKKNVKQGAEDSKGSNLTKFVLKSSKKS